MKVALALHRIGLRGSLMHSLGIGSIMAAISLWGRSRSGLRQGSPSTSRAPCNLYRALATDLFPAGKGPAGHGGNARRAGLAGAWC
jgi:hypothetical protein